MVYVLVHVAKAAARDQGEKARPTALEAAGTLRDRTCGATDRTSAEAFHEDRWLGALGERVCDLK